MEYALMESDGFTQVFDSKHVVLAAYRKEKKYTDVLVRWFDSEGGSHDLQLFKRGRSTKFQRVVREYERMQEALDGEEHDSNLWGAACFQVNLFGPGDRQVLFDLYRSWLSAAVDVLDVED